MVSPNSKYGVGRCTSQLYLPDLTYTAIRDMVPTMKTSIYLPDDVHAKAKEAGLSLSGVLRDGIEREVTRREVLERAKAGEPQTYELDLNGFVGRVEAILIVDSKRPETNDSLVSKAQAIEGKPVQVYLLTDGRLLAYLVDERGYVDATEDPQQVLRPLLPNDAYVRAMNAVGITPTINL